MKVDEFITENQPIEDELNRMLDRTIHYRLIRKSHNERAGQADHINK
jgi:hypothetical protein